MQKVEIDEVVIMEQLEVVTMHQAKSTLSQLVKRAAEGETIFIGARGYATAKLVAADYNGEKPVNMKVIGSMKGQFVVPEDFDAPLPDDMLDAFEGRA